MKEKMITGLILLFSFLSCKPRIYYPLPENASANSKKVMQEYFNQGKDLYKINCSSCHGIYSRARDNSPDFTNQQLDTYLSKLKMESSDQHSMTEHISYNDMEAILHFLTYKRVRK
ncbi:MAG: cytochrome c [Saprospiraceae bacterium]|nr:cytochrome c [Saprospiraceae bacterium]